jgi:plastocyanin
MGTLILAFWLYARRAAQLGALVAPETRDTRVRGGALMRLSYVLLAIVAIGCGGGGDSGYPTSTGTGNGTGTGSGTGTGTGTGSGTGTASGTASVSITATDDGYGYASYAFSPTSVTITKGGTVTWSNGGGVAHNITFSTTGAPTNVANFSSGTSSRTFDNAGTFSYQCTNHPGMSGTVTVQ